MNCIASGPVLETAFSLDAMPEEDVAEFGKDYPLGRTAQPAELAPPYVMLASDEASYISGATIAVTRGKPMMSSFDSLIFRMGARTEPPRQDCSGGGVRGRQLQEGPTVKPGPQCS